MLRTWPNSPLMARARADAFPLVSGIFLSAFGRGFPLLRFLPRLQGLCRRLGGRALFNFSKAEKSQGITGQEADLTRTDGIWAWFWPGRSENGSPGLPDHRPFYSRFLSDDLGRLYVIRFKPITEKDVKTSDIDVFSKDGYYLYRMTWPFVPHLIMGGHLYEVRQDEDAA